MQTLYFTYFLKCEYVLTSAPVLYFIACCTALAELVLNDANGQQIIQANGLYSLGLLILPEDVSTEKDKKRATKLQVSLA